MKARWIPWIVAAAVLDLAPSLARAESLSREDWDALLDAIETAESNSDTGAVGDSGKALGPFQIHRAYWQDGTHFLGVDWSYVDAHDPAKARQVVAAYLRHYGKNKSVIELARIHNGGPQGDRKRSTLPYAAKIARLLKDEKSSPPDAG